MRFRVCVYDRCSGERLVERVVDADVGVADALRGVLEFDRKRLEGRHALAVTAVAIDDRSGVEVSCLGRSLVGDDGTDAAVAYVAPEGCGVCGRLPGSSLGSVLERIEIGSEVGA